MARHAEKIKILSARRDNVKPHALPNGGAELRHHASALKMVDASQRRLSHNGR